MPKNKIATSSEPSKEQTERDRKLAEEVAELNKVLTENEKKPFDEISEMAAEQGRLGDEYMRAFAEKTKLIKKDEKMSLYTAEGKILVREFRDEIRFLLDDFKKKPPVSLNNYRFQDDFADEQDNTDKPKTNIINPDKKELNFAERLQLAVKELTEAVDNLKDYVAETTPTDDEAFSWSRIESLSYLNSLKNLNNAMKYLNGCFFFEESDEDERFRKLYTSTANLSVAMENISKGNLTVPLPGTKNQSGKKVHFVNNLKNTVFHQPLAKFSTNGNDGFIDPRELEGKTKEEKWKASDDHYADVSYLPLFSHEPCAEDVCQGGLGDCYALSMISAIATIDPQFIKDSMVDNGDNVTVRFFTWNEEPVYVTVDKKIPGHVGGTKYDIKQPYSVGPIWVKLLEKAYAVSGLKNRMLKRAEKGEYFGSHYDIWGGRALDFAHAFLGNEMDAIVGNEDIYIPEPNNLEDLTNEEVYFLNSIKNAVNKGQIIYAGTKFNENKEAIQSEKTNGDEDFTGIYNKHAHSVHGVVKKGDHYYIKIRNPHGGKGRIYTDDGKAAIDMNANGYNLVDIKVFGHYFNEVKCADVSTNLIGRRNQKESQGLREMYGDTVKIIEKTLRQTDGFYMKAFNSPEFNEMRQASLCLKELMDRKHPHPESIKSAFNYLFTSANEYIKYRDNNKTRDISGDLGDRAANRYQIAELIVNLGEFYKDNPGMKKADPKALAEVCTELGDNPSQAKRASVEVIRRRAEAARQNQQNSESEVNNAPLNDNIVLS